MPSVQTKIRWIIDITLLNFGTEELEQNSVDPVVLSFKMSQESLENESTACISCIRFVCVLRSTESGQSYIVNTISTSWLLCLFRKWMQYLYHGVSACTGDNHEKVSRFCSIQGKPTRYNYFIPPSSMLTLLNMKYFVLEFASSGKGGKFVDTRNKSHESRKSINFSLYFMTYLNDNIRSSTW